jgi:hypothetical protein
MREAGRRLLRRLRKLCVSLPLTDFENKQCTGHPTNRAGASPNQQGAGVAKCLTLIVSDRCSSCHRSYCGSSCSQLSGERPNALGDRIAMSGEIPGRPFCFPSRARAGRSNFWPATPPGRISRTADHLYKVAPRGSEHMACRFRPLRDPVVTDQRVGHIPD